jgi:hypothetical protein
MTRGEQSENTVQDGVLETYGNAVPDGLPQNLKPRLHTPGSSQASILRHEHHKEEHHANQKSHR